MEKTCCITGHRTLPSEQQATIRLRLEKEIANAISQGFTRFLSGYAEGIDLMFAELMVAFMDTHPHIWLEAAIPYRGRINRLLSSSKTSALLLAADKVTIACEGYSPSCFHIRNRYMVAQSSRVIAVHDGRKTGGAAATLRYAKASGKEIREILFS